MDQMIQSVIAGLPNFIGLVLAILVLREQNQRLLVLLEVHWKPCFDDPEKTTPL